MSSVYRRNVKSPITLFISNKLLLGLNVIKRLAYIDYKTPTPDAVTFGEVVYLSVEALPPVRIGGVWSIEPQ